MSIMLNQLLEVENPWGVSVGDGLYINPLQFSDEGFFVSLEVTLEFSKVRGN